MKKNNGYYYLDFRRREVFHVPGVFVLIEPITEPTEVILEPRRLRSQLQGLKRVIENDIRDIQGVEVPQEDIQKIISLCFSHKKRRAKDYCEKLFDRMVVGLAAFYNEGSEEGYSSELGYDPDGFDPRFIESLF